jgi:hypothetical protein
VFWLEAIRSHLTGIATPFKSFAQNLQRLMMVVKYEELVGHTEKTKNKFMKTHTFTRYRKRVMRNHKRLLIRRSTATAD